MIPRSTIDTVRLRADIVSVVGEHCTLRKSGSRLVCCCPFHGEKTPSFFVNVNSNSWHCFGCGEGGDAIAFVQKKEGLDFTSAVRKLAAQFGVVIEEEKEELTAEQREQALKKEALLALYSYVQRYYAGQLFADTPEAQAALRYACRRWDKEFVQERGIGYACSEWQGLIGYAREHNLSLELLQEVGLVSEKNGRQFDFFRARLMIPIRNRYGQVIGYTARTLSDDKETPKYINSKTSLLYRKERSIFGIDTAWRASQKTGQFVLVEGAPDVLRLQMVGVLQAVACLGSQWTDEQFALLKHYANTLLFVPDADTPKDGQHYGTGIAKVLEAGKRAYEQGFSVYVKEIPLGANNTKQDAGSYCRTRTQYEELETQDFVVWYAEKRVAAPELFDSTRTPVEDVAELLAPIEQEHEIDRLITLLHGVIRGKSMWRKAILEAKRRRSEAALRPTDKNALSLDLFEKFGFQEKAHTYITIGQNGKPVRWSNFTLKPLFHIRDNQSALRLFEIENEEGDTAIVEFKQEDLVSLSKFKQKVESLGNYVWLAKDEQLTRLKQFLYKTTETADLITQLGWQRKGFFAFGNGIFDGQEWHAADSFGIVRLGTAGNYYLPAFSSIYRDDAQLFQFERNFVHREWGQITLRRYAEQLIRVFGDNAKVGLAFLLATLFRDIVTSHTKSFPILNLFGPKGSGKSELGHSLMSFFIIENTPPNIQNSTLPALADTVAQCANALVHIDEFKNTIDIDKREFLKGLWDGTGRNRMNMDKDKKREVTRVDCGVILSGQEMATADIALFSRFIFLRYNKSEFSAEQKEQFQALKYIRKTGCTHLTLEILRHRKAFEAGFRQAFEEAFRDMQSRLNGTSVEDRILLNWTIPLAAYRCLQDKLDLPFNYAELCSISAAGIVAQNRELKHNNEVSVFWDIVNFLRQDGQIVIGADYRLEHTSRLKVDEGNTPQEFPQPKHILLLKYKRIFELYQLHGKKVGETLLPKTSLAYYVENSSAYLGRKRSVRFKNIIRGVQQTTTTQEGSTTTFSEESTIDQAYCFDYDLLKEQFGINLEVSTLSIYSDFPSETPPADDSSDPADEELPFDD